MKRSVLPIMMAVTFAWQGFGFADSSVDDLIQTLEQKGILNAQEAARLKDKASAREQESEQTIFKSMLPDWINGFKITGDMRLRYQSQERDIKNAANGGSRTINPHDRGRVRARLNFEDQINDKFKFVFGVGTDGTGGNNGSGVSMYNFSRSNNYSFGGNGSNTANQPTGAFAKDFVVVNKAYGEYTPVADMKIDAGKMDNPIWEPSSISGEKFLWDPNITPEGGAVTYQKKISDFFTPFTTDTIFVETDESNSSTDTWMSVNQIGAKGNVTEKAYYKVAGSYYSINNEDHIIQQQRSNDLTNTTMTNCPHGQGNSINGLTNCYEYTYDALVAAIDVGLNDPFGKIMPSFINIPQIGVRGEIIRNPESKIPSDQKNGWEIGGYMGNSALNGWGTWQFSGDYRVLEQNAWMDNLPDFDQYTGDTDIQGFRTELDIGLMKNVWMDFNFFDFHIYKPFYNPALAEYSGGNPDITDAKAREVLYQVDLNMKF